jgi:hypothetical protein
MNRPSGLVRLALISSLVLLAVALLPAPVSLAQTDFSEWAACTGNPKVQYRWKRASAAPNAVCSLEMKNLDDYDHHGYKGTISYAYKDAGSLAPIVVLRFAFAGTRPTESTNAPCTRVTGVSLTAI